MKIKLFIISILSCLLACPAFGQAGNNALKTDAANVFNQLDADGRYVEDIKSSDLNVLPFGMRKTISNNEFAVAISHVKSNGDYVELTAFARMKIGQRKDPIYFAATGLKFSAEAGFLGDASLVLIGDIDIPVNEHMKIILRGGDFNQQTGAVTKEGGTSMSIDCSGFKELAINASLILSQSLLTRVSESGQPANAPVSADFSLTINDWSNMIVELSLPDFQVKGLDGFIFSLSNIVFDFSDFANSSHIPADYMSQYLGKHFPGCPSELWRGIYAGEVRMTLPNDFSDGSTQASISAQNFLIDENGITGKISGKNILPIETGNASGWAFSIDDFRIALETNKVTSGGFSGLIGLPVSENGALLDYNAQIMGNNNYQLNVSVKEKMEFDMLLAQARLDPNSWVSLHMVNGKFLPEANLNGALTIETPLTGSGNTNSSDKKTELKDIRFTNMHFMTTAPYISVESMGYQGEIRLLGLPVSISGIDVHADNGRLDLGCNISLNLDDKFLNASTGLHISSEYGISDKRGRWKYKGTKADEIGIHSEVAGVLTLDGHLKIMNNDPSYGDGFYGDISMTFKSLLKGTSVAAAAAFGNKDGERYWFVDGSVGFPTPIPVVGVLGINGFGGGLSMGMRRMPGGLGSNLSKTGCGFVPDKNAGLGFKAAVMFKTTAGDLLSGDASFEMIFNKSGGVNTVGFYGYVAFTAAIPGLNNIPGNVSSLLAKYVDKENTLVQGSLEKIAALEKKKNDNPSEAAKETTDAADKAANANIAAAIGILYTQPTHTLHATFDFYVNVAGGLLRGSGANNRAGWGELHISPSNWHIYMGTPEDRCGLQLGIPGIATIKTTSYFMLGDNIPGSPPPPDKVIDFLGGKGESYDYMRDLNLLRSGTGIAFGTSLGFSTGDLTCLILYARFDMEAGFDIMLKNYQNVQCKGRSGPIGMNGWYANGQSYFYMAGEVGVKVNLKFIKGRFPIISGGTAALLQAKLPNPTWFGGTMGVKFNLLGGLVKGNTKFKFSFGDECELVIPGSSPLDVSMISDLTPSPNATNVDVFAAPQLALTYPANQEFEFSDEEGTKQYRINISKFTVKDGNQTLPGEIRWNRENTLATFYSHDALPPQKQLKLEVAIGFEEYKNNRWSAVTTSGQASAETRDLTFTTGDAPDYVPLENIEYAYPLLNQKYYYPGESKSGYVQLKRGQSYLFPDGWKYGITVSSLDGGQAQKASFSYNPGEKRMVYSFPKELARQKSYQISFISVSGAKSETPPATTKETVLLNDEDNSVVQTSAAAGNIVREDGEKSVLDYAFSSSKYSTFATKMAKVTARQTLTLTEGPYTIGLGFSIATMDEYFEEAEIYGTPESGNKPLIRASAIFEGNKYYKEYIYPLIYRDYSQIGIRLNRDGDETGIPPVYAFGKYLAEEGRFPIRYEAPRYFFYDFGELQSKYVNAGRTELSSSQYPDILSGEYPALLEYILPGGERGSKKDIKYEIHKK